ncbi:MAG: flagellar brake protein, partial [Planctomycetota bacterium]
LIALFGGTAVAFILYMIILGIRRALLRRELDWDEFFSEAESRRLSREEQMLMANLARKRNVSPPAKMLRDFGTFDQFIKAEIAAVEGRPLTALKNRARFRYYRNIRNKLGFAEPPRVHGLKSTHDLATGQTLSISISDGREKRTFDSSVTGLEELEFTVHLPEDLSTHPALKTGKLVDLEFYVAGDATYTAHARVTNTLERELSLSHTPQLRRIQQREAVRAPIDVPIVFQIRTGKHLYGPPQQGKTVDISAGGISFAATTLFEAGTEMKLEFRLGPENEFKIHGVVRRSQKLPLSEGRVMLKNHVQFTDLEEKDQDAIVRHIFKSYYRR